jgi:hypothetical protein
MSLYHLIRLQNDSQNQRAYKIVRDCTASHQNAFFDIVDRALNGANTSRDNEMCMLLGQSLQRPSRDDYADLTYIVPLCGSQACQPVAVALRRPTDYLWQRDPFQISGGFGAVIEGAGIDFILPYWMGRYYGTVPAPATGLALAAE